MTDYFRTEVAGMDGQLKILLQTRIAPKSKMEIPSSQKNFWQEIGCFLQKAAWTKVTEHGLIARLMITLFGIVMLFKLTNQLSLVQGINAI